jgi:death-on-curing protein
VTDDDDLPTPTEILDTHEEIEEEYDLKYKGTKKAAPKLKLRREAIGPAAEHDDPYHRAAVLLFKIQSVHVFEDANKRTAWTETMAYLNRKGIDPDLPQDDDTIEHIVRRAGLFDTDELAEWFETGKIDVGRLSKH